MKLFSVLILDREIHTPFMCPISDRRNDSSDGGGKASPILEKLEIYGDGPPDSALQFPRRSVPYFASMLIEAFSYVQFVPLTPK